MSRTSTTIAGVALVGGAYIAGSLVGFGELNPFSAESKEHIGIEKNTIVKDGVSLELSLGILTTGSVVTDDAEGSIGLGPIKHHWSDRYTGRFAGDISFVLKSADSVGISTSRKDLTTPPLASDEVTVLVNRNALGESRPRVSFLPEGEDNSFVVKNGHVIERGGVKVPRGEFVFAKDGKYNEPASKIDGRESYRSRFFHNISVGNFNNGKDAKTHTVQVGQVAAQSPYCVAEAWKVSSPDERAKIAVKNFFGEQGYSPNHINVNFVVDSKWPKPEDLTDESDRTFAQNKKAVEKALPDSEKIGFKTECNTGTSHRPNKHHKSGNLQASAEYSQIQRQNTRTARP